VNKLSILCSSSWHGDWSFNQESLLKYRILIKIMIFAVYKRVLCCIKASEAKMEKRIMQIMTLLVIFLVVPFAQDQNSDEKIKDTIENLFSVSKDKDYNKACTLIVYTGSDSQKDYTVALNPRSTTDLEKAERIAKKIKAYLDISDSYNINSVVTDKKGDKNFTDVEVGFKSGKQTLNIDFKFVVVNNNFLLVSVD